MKSKIVKALTESAIMIAMAMVLSLVKLVELPYGGSVTFASILPIAIIAYRHKFVWGLYAGLSFGVIKQIMNIGNLSYVTTWQSVLAVILLDYIVAYAVICTAGIFRNIVKSRSLSLMLGTLLCSVLRYTCHVISGATVWAGLSIPTEAALRYSLIYNATYMLPETIVLCISALYLGANIDLLADKPLRIRRETKTSFSAFAPSLAGAMICGAVIYDTVTVFPRLQNSETGEFDISQIVNINYSPIIIVTAIAVFLAAGLLIFRIYDKKKSSMGAK